LKRNMAFVFSSTMLLFATSCSLAAQQPAVSPASSTTVNAEDVNEANIRLMRQDIRAERKKIVAANLPLTETEATKFWPVYDRYIGETIKVNDVRYGLIKEYAKNYQSMTEDQANSYIKRWLSLDRDNTDLRLKFIPEFEKVVSRQKTAMFFQIDRRVAMMIELQLSSMVPLVSPK